MKAIRRIITSVPISPSQPSTAAAFLNRKYNTRAAADQRQGAHQVRQYRPRGNLRTKRDGGRDGSRAGSQWERHRKEAPPHDLGVGERGRFLSGGRMNVVVFGVVEHSPSRRR